jgi:hypothetical protein
MYDHINLFGKSIYVSILVLCRISCIASGLALLKDEQKLKLGGFVGTHKMLISCANISSNCIVIPHSEREGTKPPYVCPGCSNHTYSNNMITRFHVQ